jgi:DNA-directed RNA polymerase specialized sigma24 family protein
MENISGHAVSQRKRIVPFTDGLNPEHKPLGSATDEHLIQQEEVDALLAEIFQNDTDAAKIFVLRVEGLEATQIRTQLGLTALQYETVAKRIRRKIAIFITNT